MVSSGVRQRGSARLKEIVEIMRNAVKVSVLKEVSIYGIRDEHIYKSEAYRRYGRSTVDRWLKENLITFYKTFHKKNMLKLAELEKVASKSNRISYLQVFDR